MPLARFEYVIISFPGSRFSGKSARALAKLVERGSVHILDLVFIKKGADGAVTSFEFGEMDVAKEFPELAGEVEALLYDDDIAHAAERLTPDTSALFIVWEDLCAAGLQRAVLDSGGEFVAGVWDGPQHIVEA